MKQALHYSIASAAIAGLLTGAVMKLGPDALSEHGGPRILIPGSGERVVTAPAAQGGVTFTSRNGEIPEYVLGSDWTRPPEYLSDYLIATDVYAYGYDAAAYAAPPEPEPEVEEAVFITPVKVSSPPPPPRPASYPSVDGDILPAPALTEVVEAQEDTPDRPS